MNGSDLGNAVMSAIVGLVIIALLVGAVVGLGGYFGISWLINHVSITFN